MSAKKRRPSALRRKQLRAETRNRMLDAVVDHLDDRIAHAESAAERPLDDSELSTILDTVALDLALAAISA